MKRKRCEGCGRLRYTTAPTLDIWAERTALLCAVCCGQPVREERIARSVRLGIKRATWLSR